MISIHFVRSSFKQIGIQFCLKNICDLVDCDED